MELLLVVVCVPAGSIYRHKSRMLKEHSGMSSDEHTSRCSVRSTAARFEYVACERSGKPSDQWNGGELKKRYS